MPVQNKTVLILEDDADEAFLLSRAMRYADLGCDTEFVGNGREAIAYLNGDPPFANREVFPLPDLILVDVTMPELSGLQFLEWIRKHPEFKRIPVLMLTNSIVEDDRREAERLGAQGFFVKPANSNALYSLVKQIDHDWIHPSR